MHHRQTTFWAWKDTFGTQPSRLQCALWKILPSPTARESNTGAIRGILGVPDNSMAPRGTSNDSTITAALTAHALCPSMMGIGVAASAATQSTQWIRKAAFAQRQQQVRNSWLPMLFYV